MEKEEVIELTLSNFNKEIKNGNWVIDFWAPWCNPCKIMEPYFKEAARDLKGKIKFGKVNVDEEQDLAQRFEVLSIPTTILFKSSEQVNVSVGSMNKSAILRLIDETF